MKKALVELFGLTSVTLLLLRLPSAGLAQRIDLGPSIAASVSPDGVHLGFSSDGQMLHVIGAKGADLASEQSVRAITYDAVTGIAVHLFTLQPDTYVLAITPDGRLAIVGEPASVAKDSRVIRFDTETGERQNIPAAWYDPEEVASPDASIAELSGNGNLVSFYDSGRGDVNVSYMYVSVFDWATQTLLARKMSEEISAGGINGGGVTNDGAEVEFTNNRVGRKLVDIKTSTLLAWFAFSSVRSPDGAWVVEFPDLSFNESLTHAVLVKDGRTGQLRGRLDVQPSDDEVYGDMTGAFCGTSGRFVLARRRGVQSVAIYAIPSGALLASFATATWQDLKAKDGDPISVACSTTGTRVAILSGTRLTLRNLQ